MVNNTSWFMEVSNFFLIECLISKWDQSKTTVSECMNLTNSEKRGNRPPVEKGAS